MHFVVERIEDHKLLLLSFKAAAVNDNDNENKKNQHRLTSNSVTNNRTKQNDPNGDDNDNYNNDCNTKGEDLSNSSPLLLSCDFEIGKELGDVEERETNL